MLPLSSTSLVGGGPKGGRSCRILIVNVLFATPPQFLPLVLQEGILFMLLFLPRTMGGPWAPLTMAPTSEPTHYTVAPWDRFPETETRAPGSAPVS